MTEQQIIDNNKLIAEFMEAKPNLYTLDKDGSRNYFYEIHCGNIYEKAIKPKGMPFHTDWNWLMSVMKKIRHTEITMFDYGKRKFWIHNALAEADIEKVYIEIVKFIKWYNKEGKL